MKEIKVLVLNDVNCYTSTIVVTREGDDLMLIGTQRYERLIGGDKRELINWGDLDGEAIEVLADTGHGDSPTPRYLIPKVIWDRLNNNWLDDFDSFLGEGAAL